MSKKIYKMNLTQLPVKLEEAVSSVLTDITP